MTRRIRNLSAIAGIAAYCIFALVITALPSSRGAARDIALIILGLLEIGISAAYLAFNRPVTRKELRTELICCGAILVAIVFVGLQYAIR